MSYNKDEVKDRASGIWPAIINRVAGIPDDFLSTRHGPCPKCGGDDHSDRWRVFNDFQQTGGAVCNQCGKFGDGLAVIEWYLGCSFVEAVDKVASFLGMSASRRGKPKGKSDPSSHLEELAWSDQLVSLWCLNKKPITPAAIRALDGRLARYRKRYTVIAIPTKNQSGVCGWAIYQTNGRPLPVFSEGKVQEHRGMKVTAGSERGWIKTW